MEELRQDPTQLNRLPNRKDMMLAYFNSRKMLSLGEQTVEYLESGRHKGQPLDPQWKDKLRQAVAILKDSLEAGLPSNVAATEVYLVLGKPKHDTPYIPPDEPSDAQVRGWAWGDDIAGSVRYFLSAGASVILSVLAFGVLAYGLDTPGSRTIILFSALGGSVLSFAWACLGYGLYRIYVTSGYEYEEYQGWLEVEIRRRRAPWKIREWYVYSLGGVCLAACIALVFIANGSLDVEVVEDYTSIRLTTLASAATGFLLLSYGAWPIIRGIIIQSEVRKRENKPALSLSPRFFITALPVTTGLVLLIINWLFRSS